MQWNDHHELEGKHAFLGASNFRWMNQNDVDFEKRYYAQFATSIGTAIHELAKDCIDSRMKLTKHDKRLVEYSMYKNGIPKRAYDPDTILTNLLPFVNDAIGYRMSSEIILFYTYNSFGTTDAIVFNEKEKTLRIHDLKTGTTPSHIEQLIVYAALFCLEYKKKPKDFTTELRIYQSSEILNYTAEPMEIEKTMELIKLRDSDIKEYYEGDFR